MLKKIYFTSEAIVLLPQSGSRRREVMLGLLMYKMYSWVSFILILPLCDVLKGRSQQNSRRWQDTDRWGFDRELMVCYQSDLIMGSVSEQEYCPENYDPGEEVNPAGVFLHNPRTITVLLLKNRQRLANITACYISLSLSLVCNLVISFLLLITVVLFNCFLVSPSIPFL